MDAALPGAKWQMADAAEIELAAIMGQDENHIKRHTAVRDLFGDEGQRTSGSENVFKSTDPTRSQ